MDFLSRLIGGVAIVPGRRSNVNNPQQRLARFKKTYSLVLQAWNKASPTKIDPASIDSIRVSLQRLTNLLQDDTRAPAPHLCLSFAASSQIYITIARIALSLNNEDIIRETVAIFSALVDNDEENLLGTSRFSKGLMTFVDRVLKTAGLVGPQTQGEILELIFGIAAKIRLDPDLLPVWFRPRASSHEGLESAGDEKTPQSTEHKDFPLCYQFIDYVYNDGRAGDFARTGLLYIFESASNSGALEEWIIESDLPTLMASNLGALYSALSRKLVLALPQTELPLILALSDNDKPPPTDVENYYSDDLQMRLAAFMSNLVFWQDILEHCRSIEIKQTLIDHFHVFFLQQILYPSMLQSSDIDGGSSVAVLTYLWRMLDLVDHPDLIHLILKYLLAIAESLESSRPNTALSRAHEERRKSLVALSQAKSQGDGLNPVLFNLVDLIRMSIQSKDPQTVTAALRVIKVIVHKHHALATSALIKTVPYREDLHGRNVGAAAQELDIYLSIAKAVGGEEGLSASYEGCLKDALASIESHVCSINYLGRGELAGATDAVRRRTILAARNGNVEIHCLLVEDPLIQGLMDLLKTFLTNSIETNLELTNVISSLASCPFTRLEGWLAVDPVSQLSDNEMPPVADTGMDSGGEDSEDVDPIEPEEEELKRITAYKAALRCPPMTDTSTPAIFAVLEQLKKQVDSVKRTVPQLQQFVSSRRRAFQGATEFENDPIIRTSGISSPIIGSRNASRTRQGSIPTLIAPNDNYSRSGSPTRASRDRQRRANVGRSEQIPTSPLATQNPLSPTGSSSASSRGASPSKVQRSSSPLKKTFTADELGPPATDQHSTNTSVHEDEEEEIFEKIIELGADGATLVDGVPNIVQVDGDADETPKSGLKPNQASFNHILTNVVILQEFLLELAAIIHVRASMLDGELRFL